MRMARSGGWCLWLLLVAVACAHLPPRSNVKDLKKAAESFHERMRWNDFVGTAQMLTPDLRKPYLEAREARHDERDLSVNDFELLDVQLKADARHGMTLSKISWTRLPSVSVQTATVTTDFVYENGAWFVERMEQGPFQPELDSGS